MPGEIIPKGSSRSTSIRAAGALASLAPKKGEFLTKNSPPAAVVELYRNLRRPAIQCTSNRRFALRIVSRSPVAAYRILSRTRLARKPVIVNQEVKRLTIIVVKSRSFLSSELFRENSQVIQ